MTEKDYSFRVAPPGMNTPPPPRIPPVPPLMVERHPHFKRVVATLAAMGNIKAEDMQQIIVISRGMHEV